MDYERLLSICSIRIRPISDNSNLQLMPSNTGDRLEKHAHHINMQINIILHIVEPGQFRLKVIIGQFELWHLRAEIGNHIAHGALHDGTLIAVFDGVKIYFLESSIFII